MEVPPPSLRILRPAQRNALRVFCCFLSFVARVLASKRLLSLRKRSYIDDMELPFALAAERPAIKFGISLFV